MFLALLYVFMRFLQFPEETDEVDQCSSQYAKGEPTLIVIITIRKKIKISENSIDGEEEDTADEPATATPEIQSSNVLSKTPGSDKFPEACKRRKLAILTQAVQQLWELSQNIQDSSNNGHEAFGNFVAATLNNLGKADALMAQHEIQGVLFKYKLANVDSSKYSSFQEPNSNKNTQTTPSYSYNNSLQSPCSNHSIDGYPHQQYSENTNSTFYSDKHTNAPQQINIEGQSLNLYATSLANEHTNDDSIISQALRFISN
ncbi:hypothetical protein FQA39_LY13214 [Lamprigera yunnana]|nr:hypothetical protein FQA39_LY13214 [Lamprigera yunnana]